MGTRPDQKQPRTNWGGSLERPFWRVWLQTLGREQLARAARPPGQGGKEDPRAEGSGGARRHPHLPWSCLFIFRLLTWPFPDSWPSSLPGCGCQHPPCCPMSPRRDTAARDGSVAPTARGERTGAARALGSQGTWVPYSPASWGTPQLLFASLAWLLALLPWLNHSTPISSPQVQGMRALGSRDDTLPHTGNVRIRSLNPRTFPSGSAVRTPCFWTPSTLLVGM